MRRLLEALAAAGLVASALGVGGHTAVHAAAGLCQPLLRAGDDIVSGTPAGRNSSVARFDPQSGLDCVDFEGTGDEAIFEESGQDAVTFNGSGDAVRLLPASNRDGIIVNGSGDSLTGENVGLDTVTVDGGGDAIDLGGSENVLDIVGSGDDIVIEPGFEHNGINSDPFVISGNGERIVCSGSTCSSRP